MTLAKDLDMGYAEVNDISILILDNEGKEIDTVDYPSLIVPWAFSPLAFPANPDVAIEEKIKRKKRIDGMEFDERVDHYYIGLQEGAEKIAQQGHGWFMPDMALTSHIILKLAEIDDPIADDIINQYMLMHFKTNEILQYPYRENNGIAFTRNQGFSINRFPKFYGLSEGGVVLDENTQVVSPFRSEFTAREKESMAFYADIDGCLRSEDGDADLCFSHVLHEKINDSSIVSKMSFQNSELYGVTQGEQKQAAFLAFQKLLGMTREQLQSFSAVVKDYSRNLYSNPKTRPSFVDNYIRTELKYGPRGYQRGNISQKMINQSYKKDNYYLELWFEREHYNTFNKTKPKPWDVPRGTVIEQSGLIDSGIGARAVSERNYPYKFVLSVNGAEDLGVWPFARRMCPARAVIIPEEHLTPKKQKEISPYQE